MINIMPTGKVTIPCTPAFCLSCGHYIGDIVEVPNDIECQYCKKNNHCNYEYRK